jgi:DEAD/DEAH box helicase domain-containing protein
MDGGLFLEEGEMFGHAGDQTLDLYFAAKKRSPQEWADTDADCRILLRGTLPQVTGEPTTSPGYSEAWRGLWRIVNLFQDVRGFHVEFEGLDTLAAPDLTIVATGPQDGAWLEVMALIDDTFRPLAQAIQAAEVQPPDLIGADLTHNDEVVGMIEFGWSNSRVAICEDKFEVPDWDLIPYGATAGNSLAELVAMIIQKIEEKAP